MALSANEGINMLSYEHEDYEFMMQDLQEDFINGELQMIGEEIRYEHGLLAFDASAGF